MTLKFKRNFPLVLLLAGILCLLVLTMGNQPIISYTVNMDAFQTVQLNAITDDLAPLTSLFGAQTTDTGLRINAIQP